MNTRNIFYKAEDIRVGRIPFVEQHVHTDYTDGMASPRAIVEQAISMECRRIIFTEHVQRQSQWFPDFRELIFGLQREYRDRIDIGLGIEAKLLDYDGNIDCLPEFLEDLDIVIGSVHGYPDGTGGYIEFDSLSIEEALAAEIKATLSLIRANNGINVLGHPFGAAIHHYGISVGSELFTIIAREIGNNPIAFEINTKYHANCIDNILTACMGHNILINIGSDVHYLEDVGTAFRTLRGYCKNNRYDYPAKSRSRSKAIT